MPRLLLVAALLIVATLALAHLAASREDHDLVLAELSFAEAEAAALRARPGDVEDWIMTHPDDELHFRFKVVAVDGETYAVEVDAASGEVSEERLKSN